MLTRAIHRNAAVEISYRALSSGLTTREIVPFALADSGQRWHVRAFDRRSGEFRDFVLGRIADAQIHCGRGQGARTSEQDIQWNRVAELELVPHPANVQHPDTIEAEYGMENGVAQGAGARRNGGLPAASLERGLHGRPRLKGAEFHLWLRNRQALYGVTNLVLAPGYEPEKQA